jgi:hypothetical protein
MQFPVARETSIDGWDNHDGYGDPPVYDAEIFTPEFYGGGQITEEWTNFGASLSVRARKANQHAVIMDWDTDAINAFLAANADPTQPMTWSLGVYPTGAPPTFDVTIETIESVNDWAEGNGDGSYANFNWEVGTKAATTNFAQTAYTLNEDDVPVLDLENSLPWIDNDTGTGGIDDNQYSILGRADNWSPGLPVSDFINSEMLLQNDLVDALTDATFATVPLDNDLVNAILTDPNNRGVMFGPKDNPTFDNWEIYSRENDGLGGLATELPGPLAAFLEVTYTPGAGPPDGDFDNSGALDAVDINDLTTQSAGGTNPAAYDLNSDALVNDGDVNVWVKDLFNSWIGDANLDGEFNSTDLVDVLASGTYEADVPSVWTSGDFNGDGRTTSTDLVAALADGGYEVGPRGGAAAVPEPGALSLLVTAAIALSGFCLSRRGG